MESARQALCGESARCPNRRHLWATACCFRAAPRCSWTAAAAPVPLGCMRLEQELHRNRRPATSGYPAKDPDVYRQMVRMFHAGRVPRRHARHRRSRHRLGGGHVCAGAAGEADQRPAPRHHSLQYADRSRHRHHGAPCRSSTTPDIPKRRRRSCGGSGTTTRAIWDRSAWRRLMPFETYLKKGIDMGGRVGLLSDTVPGALWNVGVSRAPDAERRVRIAAFWNRKNRWTFTRR